MQRTVTSIVIRIQCILFLDAVAFWCQKQGQERSKPQYLSVSVSRGSVLSWMSKCFHFASLFCPTGCHVCGINIQIVTSWFLSTAIDIKKHLSGTLAGCSKNQALMLLSWIKNGPPYESWHYAAAALLPCLVSLCYCFALLRCKWLGVMARDVTLGDMISHVYKHSHAVWQLMQPNDCYTVTPKWLSPKQAPWIFSSTNAKSVTYSLLIIDRKRLVWYLILDFQNTQST